jgi:hypothetical protein
MYRVQNSNFGGRERAESRERGRGRIYEEREREFFLYKFCTQEEEEVLLIKCVMK